MAGRETLDYSGCMGLGWKEVLVTALTTVAVLAVLVFGGIWLGIRNTPNEVDAYAACVSKKLEKAANAGERQVKAIRQIYSEHLAPHRKLQLKWWAEGNCQTNETWDDMFDNNPRTDDW